MTNDGLLIDAFDRVRQGVRRVLEGLAGDGLTWRPDPGANSVGWLVWHVARVQDAQVAEVAGTEQVWLAGGWVGRLGLPYEAGATGYGHAPEDVGRFPAVATDLLTGYLDATHEATVAFLRDLEDARLGEVVDRRWDPPVTLGVRLVSILADDLQHLGQAAYVRGMAERAGVG